MAVDTVRIPTIRREPRGRVVPDSTRLDPPTRSRDLNRQLIREAAEWMFRPAVQEGKAVSSWYPYRIIG